MDLRKRLAKRDELRQRLSVIDHEISIYEKYGAAEKLKEATRLSSDGQSLRGATEAVGKAKAAWTEALQDALPPLDTALRALRRSQSQHKDILEEGARIIEDLRGKLKFAIDQLDSAFTSAGAEMEQLLGRWKEALRPLEEEINRIKQEAQTDALDPDRLLRLSEERAALTPAIEDLNQSEAQLKELHETRRRLLNQFRDFKYEENKLRCDRAQAIGELLGERVRLKVEFKGQKEDYKRRLGALLKGSGVSQDAIDRLVAPEATDGLAISEAAQLGPETVQKRFGLTPAMAERLINWLRSDDSRLFELETSVPPDAVRVELKVDDEYRSIDRLSVGQRATAILLLLFALEGRVLILDQPEDDLDNRFVYEDIVQMLREQKGIRDPKRRRQIIAATHNANIPVLGDSELVLALEARDNRARIVGRASLDARNIRDLVRTIMEGGEEAFRRRAEKYGGIQL
jgi:hypothetical protein